MDVLYVVEVIATPTFDAAGRIRLRTDNDPSVLEPSRLALAKRLDALGIEAEAYAERGPAAEEIKQFAERNSLDLIVIASHGISGLRARLMGSVSRAVLEEVSCPVLLLKPHGRSLLNQSSKDQSETERAP